MMLPLKFQRTKSTKKFFSFLGFLETSFFAFASTFIFIFALIFILGPSEAYGATQGHSGIDLKRIFFQSLNLLLMGCGIVYVAGPSLVNFFKEQKEQYLKIYHATKEKKQKALDKLHQSQTKLTQLEKDFTKELEKAKIASQEHHNKLLKEADENILQMEKDLKQNMQLEFYLAYGKLQSKLMEKVSKQSQQQIPSALNPKAQEKIEKHFITKVDTVFL